MCPLDESVEQTTKHFGQLENYQFRTVLQDHIGTANYLIPAKTLQLSPTSGFSVRTFHSNNSIWEAILLEKARYDMKVILESFFLFEWFPRSPGLFHTDSARNARQEARHNIETISNGVVVYNPHGKASMLDGGVGTIRLRPIKIENRDFYLMSASSNGVAHEGFPVALPSDLYNHYIDEIKDRGSLVRSLIGTLKFIPDRLITLYTDYREVPQLYLQVEDVRQTAFPKSHSMEELRVSVAVSFSSEFEGFPKVYASYVTFDPSDRRSFRENIEWLEQEYVVTKYKGRILTDFDEQRMHFEDAPFSLKKVMNLELNRAEVTSIIHHLHIDSAERMFAGVDQLKIMTMNVEEAVEKKTEVNVSGQGNIVNVAEFMSNVSSYVNQKVSQSAAPEEVQNLVKQLTEQVRLIATSVDQKKAEQMGSDLKTLSEEMTKAEPRKAWYHLTLNGLKEAAIAVGEIGKPIVETVTKLLPLLMPGS
jgi:hypothetical protein